MTAHFGVEALWLQHVYVHRLFPKLPRNTENTSAQRHLQLKAVPWSCSLLNVICRTESLPQPCSRAGLQLLTALPCTAMGYAKPSPPVAHSLDRPWLSPGKHPMPGAGTALVSPSCPPPLQGVACAPWASSWVLLSWTPMEIPQPQGDVQLQIHIHLVFRIQGNQSKTKTNAKLAQSPKQASLLWFSLKCHFQKHLVSTSHWNLKGRARAGLYGPLMKSEVCLSHPCLPVYTTGTECFTLRSQRWPPPFLSSHPCLLHFLCQLLKSFHCFYLSLLDRTPAEVTALFSRSFSPVSWDAKTVTAYIWLKRYLLSFDFDGSLPEGTLLFMLCRWGIEA